MWNGDTRRSIALASTRACGVVALVRASLFSLRNLRSPVVVENGLIVTQPSLLDLLSEHSVIARQAMGLPLLISQGLG